MNYHLNRLNLSLQDKNILFPHAISNILDFKSKLALYRAFVLIEKIKTILILKILMCDIPEYVRIEFYFLHIVVCNMLVLPQLRNR